MNRFLAVAAAVAALAASAPLAAQQNAGIPSFAPVIKRVAPAVVNIGVRGTVAAPRNPFFDDPGFRRFFGLPPDAAPREREFRSAGSGVDIDEEMVNMVQFQHAYDAGGPQTFDWQVYARIIEGIRRKVDVPVYPSIPSAGIGVGPLPPEAAERFAHVEALAARGLLEFAVIDPGSVNFTERAIGADTPSAPTYLNPESHVRHALAFAARYGFHPAYAIYEPGFTRAGAALPEEGSAPYLRMLLPAAMYRKASSSSATHVRVSAPTLKRRTG